MRTGNIYGEIWLIKKEDEEEEKGAKIPKKFLRRLRTRWLYIMNMTPATTKVS